MAEFKFECPHCQQHLKCEEKDAGRQITCPSCHHLIRIPAAPGHTASYTPESGQTWATHVPSGKVPPPEGIPIPKKKT